MNIPSRVNPFGYDNSTPPGYMQAEFLGGTGTPYINTGVVKSGEYRARCDYAGVDALLNSKWFGWNYTVDNTTYQNIFRFQALSYFGRFSHESTKGYILPVNYNQQGYIGTARNRLESTDDAGRVVLNGNVVNLSTYNNTAQSNENPRNEPVCLWFPNGVKIYVFSIFNDAANDVEFIPAIDHNGRPCMFDLVTKKTFYNEVTTGSDFIVGLTMNQALNLANLPATGGSLTVSLPLEAEFDATVQSALSAARARGWTIFVQYRESELTTDYIDVDFLESTGVQWLSLPEVEINNTDTVKCTLAILDYIDVSANGYFAIEGYDVGNKLRMYSTRTTSGGARAIGVQFGAFSVSKYALKEKEIGEMSISERGWEVNGELYAYTAGEASEFSYKNLLLFNQYVLSQYWPSKMRLYKFEVSEKNKLKPVLNSSGIPCMHDAVTDQNFYNANTEEGATPFIVGFDTTEKAAISISKLPVTTGGTLTVSLPAEAEDASTWVPEAIDIATSRGWTIITQYRTN